MTSTRILFPEFRDEQKDSRYPFVDTATLTADDNTTTIQRDTFIDASFHVINAGARLYIENIVVAPQKITINIADDTQGVIATTSFAPDPISASRTGALTLKDVYDRPAGTLITTPENLSLFAGWSPGTYEFAITATEFAATTIIPTREPGVRGFTGPNADLLTDDLWLIGDGGVTFSYAGVINNTHVIRIDVTGVPLFSRFICIPFNRFNPKNFVKTINNCPPDEYGNFTLTATGQKVADTVLRISHQNNAIFIDAVGRKVV